MDKHEMTQKEIDRKVEKILKKWKKEISIKFFIFFIIPFLIIYEIISRLIYPNISQTRHEISVIFLCVVLLIGILTGFIYDNSRISRKLMARKLNRYRKRHPDDELIPYIEEEINNLFE